MKATRRRNGLISCAQNLEMRRFSRRFPWHKPARKRATCTERELPKADRQSRVLQTTKRRCLPRRAIIRFRRRLRLRLIPLLRLSLCWLRRPQAQAPIRRHLPRHRPLPERLPLRRLESLILYYLLLRPRWLPWLSRRSSEAILSARCSYHRGSDFYESQPRSTDRSIGY